MTDEDPKARPIRVLIVDDSAVVRLMLTKLLTEAEGFVVEVAADPIIAMQKMKARRPDVLVLDIEMPRMDGLTFLRKLMAEDPIPVVVCSSHVGDNSSAAIEALSLGAIDLVAKPQIGLQDFLQESADRIVDCLRGAARARVRPSSPRLPIPETPAPRDPREYIVAIGASAGGTEALRTVLEALPERSPPIVIVQHMPEPFTGAFARSLAQSCRIEVREAQGGDTLGPGQALIAPGDQHIEIAGALGRKVLLNRGALVNRHRPSVDVLLRSVAREAGSRAVGIILTGMGGDGADGLLEMRKAGARTIAQDEATSVVFGMPKVAIQRGAARDVLPLGAIAAAILEGPVKAAS